MIILNVWEWAVNCLVLSIAAAIWVIALFGFALLMSLAKEWIGGKNGDKHG